MNTSQIPRYAVTIDGETAHIGTANELTIALDVLQGQHDHQVLEQLQPHLAEVVGGPAGFTLVMRSLSSEDQTFLIQAIGDKLAQVLQSARYLRDLVATLATEQVERALIDTLGTAGLRALLVTPNDLGETLEWIYGKNDRAVIDLLGVEHVRAMIRNGYDLSIVLNSLDEAGQQNLVEKIGWARVAQLVSNGRDLAYLLRALPGSLGKSLVDQFTRAQLIDLIGNRLDWAYLYDRLEPAEAHSLLEKIGGKPNA